MQTKATNVGCSVVRKTRLRQFYSGCKIVFVAWILLALASHYITNLIK